MGKALTDAQVIRALTNLSKRKFCHGTTSKALEGMKHCGITPRKTNSCRASIWEGAMESREGRVYLSGLHRVSPYTKEPVDRHDLRSIEGRGTSGMFGGAICFGSAEQAIKVHGGQEVILEVTGLNKHKKHLVPDEDMEKGFNTPITKGWWEFIQSDKYGRPYIQKGYVISDEERGMSLTQHTCEWVLAGNHDYKPDRTRKVIDILGYDAHPGLGNIKGDTHLPSLGSEDLQLLEQLRTQPPARAKAQIRRVCKKLPSWYHSLLTIGTVAVEGQIAEKDIKVRFARPPKDVEQKLRETTKLWGLFDWYVDAEGVPLKQWHMRKQKYFLQKPPEKPKS